MAAFGAIARIGQMVAQNHVAKTLDEQRLTLRAISILPIADLAGTIAGIDKVQPGLNADLRRPD